MTAVSLDGKPEREEGWKSKGNVFPTPIKGDAEISTRINEPSTRELSLGTFLARGP